jgi:predicted nucleic acid-binding protein
MRIVADTNVLVSGVLSAGGPPGWIVEAFLSGELDLAFDGWIRLEYEDVLRRRELGLKADRVAELLAGIDRFGFEVTAPPWPGVLPDPDDAHFLAVAHLLDCTLVTGNLKHYPASVRAGVTVLSPRQFLDRIR